MHSLQICFIVFKNINVKITLNSALSRKLSVDEVLINFDAFPPRLFHEVNAFVSNCIYESNTSSKSKKKRTGAENSKSASVTTKRSK